MLIKGLRMVNFRQYKDVKLEFSSDEKKNITLVMGDNGTGKTTLAQAFRWCLYGVTDFEIAEVINRKVRDKMVPGGRDKVVVEMEVEYNDKEYVISREQVFSKKQIKVESQNSVQRIYYKE
ncbi:MAG: ATP-binding protein, partial [Eubacterium sp.]|nr:ATP-binding protein [Eubacterium sp.]